MFTVYNNSSSEEILYAKRVINSNKILNVLQVYCKLKKNTFFASYIVTCICLPIIQGNLSCLFLISSRDFSRKWTESYSISLL